MRSPASDFNFRPSSMPVSVCASRNKTAQTPPAKKLYTAISTVSIGPAHKPRVAHNFTSPAAMPPNIYSGRKMRKPVSAPCKLAARPIALGAKSASISAAAALAASRRLGMRQLNQSCQAATSTVTIRPRVAVCETAA